MQAMEGFACAGARTSAADPGLTQGEKWEFLGKVASLALPLLVVGFVVIGFFASQTYDQGATVYVQVPTSAEDTIRLVPSERVISPP